MRTIGHGRDRARAHAPAKVNLSLRVLARESTGYHQLETVFCALELSDEVELERGGPGIELEVEGQDTGPAEANLAYRAAEAFCQACGRAAALRIRLRKRIPVGAGLGGGSSDAATTLLALNALHDEPLDGATLLRIGAGLGSDVPFFLAGSPLALAWGRGERLLPLPPLPRAPVLVAVPDFAIATADAYLALDRHRAAHDERPGPGIFEPARFGSWDDIAAVAVNDFEAPTFERFPVLGSVKAALGEAGATLSLLSGSGSALFGVFRTPEDRDRAADIIRSAHPGIRTIATWTASTMTAPGRSFRAEAG